MQAQSFFLEKENITRIIYVQEKGKIFVFDPKDKAKKIIFSFVPPAKKMLYDKENNAFLFPSLYPAQDFFKKLLKKPNFMANFSDKLFSLYHGQGIYLQLSSEYVLFSAYLKGSSLFISAKDKNGDFVYLNKSHFRIFSKNGNEISFSAGDNSYKNISLLIDRSGSMEGFDSDMSSAIKQFSKLPIINYYCGIYEFGNDITSLIQKPFQYQCKNVLTNYDMSTPSGQTPLYKAMTRAYKDLIAVDNLSTLIIISDGVPTDTPNKNLKKYSELIPTFIIWVGDHKRDYISTFSRAHAISKQGTYDELTDFFKAISFGVHAHQVFILKNK